MRDTQLVTIIGAGLAGCEAALWLANQGVHVLLLEQKPLRFSPAHKNPALAELVCSNSFKAERLESAGGLLKEEMRMMGSSLLQIAQQHRVAAGGALAVNRDEFSTAVTHMVQNHPFITFRAQQVDALPQQGVTIVASGPLTEGALAADITRLTGGNQLSFYDAAAPIVEAESLAMGQIFAASRYGRGDDDYLNCPMDKAQYEAFYEALLQAESAPLHSFDVVGSSEVAGAAPTVYEGCMPIEIMAKRGAETMRYGPLRPVGLRNPHTGHRPWANLQLRKENAAGSLYNLVGFQTNLKFGEQKRVFGLIPGLANAEYARYGVMHRNTFLNSPQVLLQNLSLQAAPNLFFAGQITGFEGYMESAACGLLAARAALAALQGRSFTPPAGETMCGALLRYITTPNKDFQPMGANMGILPPLAQPQRDKRLRYEALALRAISSLQNWQML